MVTTAAKHRCSCSCGAVHVKYLRPICLCVWPLN